VPAAEHGSAGDTGPAAAARRDPRIDALHRVLREHSPRIAPRRPELREAGVALVLRTSEELELLLIERVERAGDPWSGHMALPGGMREAADPDLRFTACRETREEVGLDLETAGERLGRLSEVRAIGRGRPLSMVICPFVFALETDPVLVTNHEVGAVVWVPLAFLADRRNRDTMQYRRGGLELELPCYHFDEYLIWGMTLGMVDELLAIADR
jgi:8-oxo-dGTP pyrophosphatase MutT (NUDIX family)